MNRLQTQSKPQQGPDKGCFLFPTLPSTITTRHASDELCTQLYNLIHVYLLAIESRRRPLLLRTSSYRDIYKFIHLHSDFGLLHTGHFESIIYPEEYS